jgi:hypothetical protein
MGEKNRACFVTISDGGRGIILHQDREFLTVATGEFVTSADTFVSCGLQDIVSEIQPDPGKRSNEKHAMAHPTGRSDCIGPEYHFFEIRASTIGRKSFAECLMSTAISPRRRSHPELFVQQGRSNCV